MLPAFTNDVHSCIGAIPSQVKDETVLYRITLPGATILAIYSDDETAFMESKAEINVVGKEINRYKEVNETKLSATSLGFAVGSVQVRFSSRTIQLDGRFYFPVEEELVGGRRKGGSCFPGSNVYER